MAPSGGQICKLCKWRHLVVNFATNASVVEAKLATNESGAIEWSNFQQMQVVPSGGQICNKCKWPHLVGKFATNASAPSGGQICN